MSTLSALEKIWKEKRDPGTTNALKDVYLTRFLESSPPEPTREALESAALAYVDEQFARLKQEVDDQVERWRIEELSRELGNLDGWEIQMLDETPPTVSGSPYSPAVVPQPPPAFVTTEGVVLWHYQSIYLPNGRRTVLSMDFPPEFVQRELEDEYGRDAEFVTVYGANPGEYIASTEKRSAPPLYQRVREFNLGEVECPFATWDSEHNEDARKNIVKETDTWNGAHPGEWCRLCEEKIGEEHGYLYDGEEPNEVVYRRIATRAEMTTQNDHPLVGEAVTETFEAFCEAHGLDSRDVFYEHGQWWARADVMGGGPEGEDELQERTFSVVDTNRGFDFEEV